MVLAMFVLSGCSVEPKKNYDNFAQCLKEKSATLYGTEWCSNCKNQKEKFGESFEFVDYVDCDIEKELCINAGIKGYPTWIINGEKYPGEMEIYELAGLTKCSTEE